MRTLFIFSLFIFVTATALADNTEKIATLKAYQSKELKGLLKKQGNIGTQAKALNDQIYNAEKFCRGIARAKGNDCAAMLDKALQAKKGLEAQNAVLNQAELQSATGGAAVTGNADKNAAKQDSTWKKGHINAGPTNTSNTVGAPKLEGKKAPVMGTKKKPAAENEAPKQ